MCSDRTTSNGKTLKHRKFDLHTIKCLFTVRVTEHWKVLPDLEQEPSRNTGQVLKIKALVMHMAPQGCGK